MGHDGEYVDIDALDYLRTLPGRRRPPPRRSYGVDVPATSFQLHGWDIHIVCRGTDDASGAGGTAAADEPPGQAAGYLIRSSRRRGRPGTHRDQQQHMPEAVASADRCRGGQLADQGWRTTRPGMPPAAFAR